MSDLNQEFEILGDGRLQGNVSENWAQGGTTFGGYLGAITCRMLKNTTDVPIRSVVVDFIKALKPGEFVGTVREIRSGRFLGRYEVTVTQDNETVGISLLTTAHERESVLRTRHEEAPDVPPPSEIDEITPADLGAPIFTRNFQWRWIEGIPFSGELPQQVMGYVRLKDVDEYTEGELVAIADTYPPPMICETTKTFPGATVMSFTTLNVTRMPADWLLWRGTSTWVGQGLAEYSATVFAPDGQLVVSMRQLWAEFSDRLLARDSAPDG